jgi:hypothetical protein
MKKTIVIAAALLLSAGVLSSQVKTNHAPTAQAVNLPKVSADKKDLSSAD